MSDQLKSQWSNSRGVTARVFVTGKLRLNTPAHFGNGDAEGLTDIPLLYDPSDGVTPLLTGASIAGALRNYLREYEKGFGSPEDKQAETKSLAEGLFGHLDGRDASTVQSWLMVDDALGTRPAKGDPVELRDGVAIDARTRIVEEDERGGHKYDFELLSAGTTFNLSFEFWQTANNGILLSALATALQGLEQGEIHLGMRKRRGFGECGASEWQVWQYRMDDANDVVHWLNHDDQTGTTKSHIADWISVLPDTYDQRKAFTVDADFELDGSLLIRSGFGAKNEADMVHLKSWRDGEKRAIVSGTSAAGAIRARALRIAQTRHPDHGAELVNAMFGRRIKPGDDPSGSRVTIRESVIEKDTVVQDLVQNRVKVDRFTGGAYPQALFSEQPVWGLKDQRAISLHLALNKTHNMADDDPDFNAQAGLLLLVLKDLWTGDLPFGGESSVGRGRMRGLHADIAFGAEKWTLDPQGKTGVQASGPDKDALEKFVDAFREWTWKEGASEK